MGEHFYFDQMFKNVYFVVENVAANGRMNCGKGRRVELVDEVVAAAAVGG